MNLNMVTRSKEGLVLACECGSTLKLSTLSDVEYGIVVKLWETLHTDHEEVTCAEAREIRRRTLMDRRTRISRALALRNQLDKRG